MSSPYQRIVRAAKRGTGAYLSPDDVQTLAGDHAISEAALDDGDKYPGLPTEDDWARIAPATPTDPQPSEGE